MGVCSYAMMNLIAGAAIYSNENDNGVILTKPV